MTDLKDELVLQQSHIDEMNVKADVENVPQIRDEAIEKRLRRKFDTWVLPLGTIIYLFAYIDRTNFGNARVLGLAGDTHMVGTRYNISLTMFYVSYIIFEMSV
jgi:hypothetical protein